MKTLILTLALIISAAAVTAQNYAVVSNEYSQKQRAVSNYATLSNFTNDVMSKEKFVYRDFLRQSKNHKKMFKVGQKTFTKKGLTKLLREAAVKTENPNEFEVFLNQDNPLMTSGFTTTEMQLLYQKFRQGSLNKYIDNLVSNW